MPQRGETYIIYLDRLQDYWDSIGVPSWKCPTMRFFGTDWARAIDLDTAGGLCMYSYESSLRLEDIRVPSSRLGVYPSVFNNTICDVVEMTDDVALMRMRTENGAPTGYYIPDFPLSHEELEACGVICR